MNLQKIEIYSISYVAPSIKIEKFQAIFVNE